MAKKIKLLAAWVFSLLISTSAACRAEECVAIPDVDQLHCKFFFHYNRTVAAADPIVATALGLGDDESTRSIAIILGIHSYPKLETGAPELLPAKNDVEHLKTFLKNDQRFDEIVVLENDDVNIGNIDYFLSSYLIENARRHPKSRVLITYSGHGVGSSAVGSKGSLLLSQARNDRDTAHMISMGVFKQYLAELAPQNFQLLALINACFGGDVFSESPAGGNIYVSGGQSARALTAGAADELVYSLGGASQGSIFFDSLIETVKSGEGEAASRISDAQGQSKLIRRGIILLGELLSQMTSNVEYINSSMGKQYAVPWEGSVMPPPLVAKAGFFFLSKKKQIAGVSPNLPSRPLAASISIGSVSSLRGRPDIKIFNQPQEYQIRGIDVSHYDGAINWSAVADRSRSNGNSPRFAYMRATMGGDRRDQSFEKNWRAVKELPADHRIDRGAYHVFDLCESVTDQIANILKTIPVERDALPLAIDIEYYADRKGSYSSDWHARQFECFKRAGIDSVRHDLKKMLDAATAHYGRSPLIFGNANVFGELLDATFNGYAIWLHDYDEAHGGTRLPGGNPWTFWQYTDKGKVQGIEQGVDQSAFYGSPEDYLAFAASGKNVALQASLSLDGIPSASIPDDTSVLDPSERKL